MYFGDSLVTFGPWCRNSSLGSFRKIGLGKFAQLAARRCRYSRCGSSYFRIGAGASRSFRRYLEIERSKIQIRTRRRAQE